MSRQLLRFSLCIVNAHTIYTVRTRFPPDSGVTRNLGPLDKYPSRALNPLSLLTLSPPSAPFLSLPSPLSVSPYLFTSFSFLPHSSPAGSSKARPPNALLCNSQPRICPNVHCNGKITFKNSFARNSGAPALGARGLCPPCPRHRYATAVGFQ